MDKIDELKNMIPEQFRRNISKNKNIIRSHPIDRMLRVLESNALCLTKKNVLKNF